MALALHRATGLPLGVWRGHTTASLGGPDGGTSEDSHAAVFLSFDPPRWIDVDGMHDDVPTDLVFSAPVSRISCVAAAERDVLAAFGLSEAAVEAEVGAASAFIRADADLSALARRHSAFGRVAA